MFTNYEIQAEMRESQQLPPHYRSGWVAAMLEARNSAAPTAIAIDRGQAAAKSFGLKAPVQTVVPLQRPGPMSLMGPKGILDRGAL
jgi:hypothetical protein